jgi:aminopeptidase N
MLKIGRSAGISFGPWFLVIACVFAAFPGARASGQVTASQAALTASSSSTSSSSASASSPSSATGSELQEQLQDHIRRLTADDMDGRGPGTAGLDRAAEYIVEEFRKAGLRPALEGGQWKQVFVPPESVITEPVALPAGAAWGKIELANIVGLLPGEPGDIEPGEGSAPTGGSETNGNEVVILGAHYDHLGAAPDGALFRGADDNASGVAALIEIARNLVEEAPYPRDVLFIAFSGEEEGTLGSRYYVEHPVLPLERTVAMINLDAVGRMEDRKLFALGSGSAAEFKQILKGINLGYRLDLAMPESGPFASDQIPFAERGIPVLHFFSGPNADYHRVTDTEEKIHYPALAEIVGFTSELMTFLAGDQERLTFVPPGAERARPETAAAGSQPRRVSLGTIPDFARESGGVLLTGVMPGSPADQIGLQKGDVLVELGGVPVDNLADFSAALKEHEPGDSVEVVVLRNGAQVRKTALLVERK